MSAPTVVPAEEALPPDAHESGKRCGTHKVYGLTCEEYEALWERAGGRCEACGILGRKTRTKQLIIDHDHLYGTRAVRGLLCSACNMWLGRCEVSGSARFSTRYNERGEIFLAYLEGAWFLRNRRTLRSERIIRLANLSRRDLVRKEIRQRERLAKAARAQQALGDWGAQGTEWAKVPAHRPDIAAGILRKSMTPQDIAALIDLLRTSDPDPA